MRFHSDKKICSTCAYMFVAENNYCNNNRNSSCMKDGIRRKWKDFYDRCNGCKYQDNQVEDPSHCKDCNQIHFTLENHYEPKEC